MTAAEGFGVYVIAAGAAAIVIPAAAHVARTGLVWLIVLAIPAAAAIVHATAVDVAPGAGRLLLATATLAGFAAALAGVVRWFGRARPWLAPIVSGLGLLALASPFVTDAFLEDRDGTVRPAVREVTLWMNPAAAMAGPEQLGVDWLRQGSIYERARLGAYHRYQYPPGWTGVGWLVVGLVFLGGGVVTSRDGASCSADAEEKLLVRPRGLR